MRVVVHQPQAVCGSLYILARRALSPGSPTLQGLLHVLPKHALFWELACTVSVFLLCSSSRSRSSLSLLLSRSTFVAALVRTRRSKQAFLAGGCIFHEQDRVDACPQRVGALQACYAYPAFGCQVRCAGRTCCGASGFGISATAHLTLPSLAAQACFRCKTSFPCDIAALPFSSRATARCLLCAI